MMNQPAGHSSEPSDHSTPGADNAHAEATKTATEFLPTIALVSPGGTTLDISIPSSIGSVKIETELGRGGMGIVFRGSDSVLHRTVAVKFLPFLSAGKDDRTFERFFGGARAEARVRHPNIVVVHAAGLACGIPYLIMDYIDGPSLHDLLRRSGCLSLAVAVKVLWDVAEAAEALHHRDVIHQDLKPGNVLFDNDGRLFVTDFGLASLRQSSASTTSAAGTPAYMAPELFEGRASPQSDVYAMGIMLYEMLAGGLPFTGDHQAIRKQHLESDLPVEKLTESVPESIIDIIQRATHKNALFRYKQAEHFHRALHDTIATDGFLRQGAIELKHLILTRDQSSSTPQSIQAGDHSSSSSYFDRIAEIAEKKRSSHEVSAKKEPIKSAQSDQAMARGDIPAGKIVYPVPDFPADAALSVHIPCIQCEYDLLGQLANTRCPECGTTVAASLRPDRLLFAQKNWLKRLSVGQLILDWALGILPWLYILFTLLVPVMNIEIIFGVTMGLSYLFIIALVVGIFVSTVREPQTQGTTRESNLPQVARVLGLLLILALLARAINGIFSLHISNVFLSIAVVAIMMGMALAYLFYSAGLANRIPNVRLGRLFRQSAILLVAVLVLSVALSAGLHQWIGKMIGVDPVPRMIIQTIAVGLFFAALLSLVLTWLQIRKLRRAIKRAMTSGVGYNCLFDGTVEMDANPSA